MWQNHNMHPFEFISLDNRQQAFLIAAEKLESEKPHGTLGKILALAKAYVGSKNKHRGRR